MRHIGGFGMEALFQPKDWRQFGLAPQCNGTAGTQAIFEDRRLALRAKALACRAILLG
jgi:hypothetical protein